MELIQPEHHAGASALRNTMRVPALLQQREGAKDPKLFNSIIVRIPELLFWRTIHLVET